MWDVAVTNHEYNVSESVVGGREKEDNVSSTKALYSLISEGCSENREDNGTPDSSFCVDNVEPIDRLGSEGKIDSGKDSVRPIMGVGLPSASQKMSRTIQSVRDVTSSAASSIAQTVVAGCIKGFLSERSSKFPCAGCRGSGDLLSKCFKASVRCSNRTCSASGKDNESRRWSARMEA